MENPCSHHDVSAPAPVLRPFIARYAGYYAEGLPPGTNLGLPSRHIHLFISLGNPIDVIRMPNRSQPAAAFTAFVSGLQDAPAIVRRESTLHGMHVFLSPFGAKALLGANGEELASRAFGLSELWGRKAENLVCQLRAAGTWPARFAILDREFIYRLRAIHTPRELVWAWSRLAQSNGVISIDGLANEIGWSRRHFSERFRGESGITPKTAARIFRFEHACRLMTARRLDLAGVAFDCGYHDQAHMTKEWNALAECTPKNWLAQQLPNLQDYELAIGDDSGIRSI